VLREAQGSGVGIQRYPTKGSIAILASQPVHSISRLSAFKFGLCLDATQAPTTLCFNGTNQVLHFIAGVNPIT